MVGLLAEQAGPCTKVSIANPVVEGCSVSLSIYLWWEDTFTSCFLSFFLVCFGVDLQINSVLFIVIKGLQLSQLSAPLFLSAASW